MVKYYKAAGMTGILATVLCCYSVAAGATGQATAKAPASLPLAPAQSQTDLAKRTTAWVFASINAGLVDWPMTDLANTLKRKQGDCSHRVFVLRDLMAKAGIRTRNVMFYGVPIQLGHTAVEIFADGRWQFFDPTIGAYFATPEEPGKPLSLEQARNLYPKVQMMTADVKPWQQADADIGVPSYSATKQGVLFDPHHPGVPILDVEKTFFGPHYSIAGQRKRYTGLVDVDLDRKASGEIGRKDGKVSELTAPLHLITGNRIYNPFLFIFGYYHAGQGPVVEHRFRFRGDRSRDVSMTINFATSLSFSDRAIFRTTFDTAAPMENIIETNQPVWSDRSVTYSFRVEAPSTTVTVQLSEAVGNMAWNVDSITWNSEFTEPAL